MSGLVLPPAAPELGEDELIALLDLFDRELRRKTSSNWYVLKDDHITTVVLTGDVHM